MFKNFQFFIFFLFVAGCIEPYKFVIRDNTPSLVVEAFLSDKSYNETVAYPSDGRYFTVKLSMTGDVTNQRPTVVSFAGVELLSDKNEKWVYTESPAQSGIYALQSNDFKAETGVQYKLRIQLPDEDLYESDWESLPGGEAPPMGPISFKEVIGQKYAIQAEEEVIVSVKGIRTQIDVPENNSGLPIYYRWSFTPHWVYIAPLSPSVVLPGHTCWATTPYYLRNYSIQEDFVGGYQKDLFFMETVRNERLFEKFSALIVQHSMTQAYYNFWKEMREQNQEDVITDKPPFNLATNIKSLNGDKRVSGYFGVVHEQATRWYVSVKDLSYFVANTLRGDCLVNYGGPPAPECFDCREYSKADASNVKPAWWMN